ncbi:hypothetical protein OSB04_019137 [Centaurea solstitialis]|uniref:DUF4216 domain-containing protein n=1 Tax=Centaurea solstitialis TaxID=347529 RepID=A0AA38SRD0_9ASTR|nr:hypothetical protein OSB04_019137 [Centaurea solstitialis]
MKASVIATISDFPGYANLSGWSTKGELACPVCGFDTNSKWLTHGRKWCYMCHRRWLPLDHHWRTDVRSFVGREELRVAPTPVSGEDVLHQLDSTKFLADNVDGGPWKKKSIFLCCHIGSIYCCVTVLTDLLKLKSYVHNRAHPEGSIAEGHLAEESITFCSRYLLNVETVFTREIRNNDEGHQNDIEESNNLCLGRPLGRQLHSGIPIRKRRRSSNTTIDEKSMSQAHRYVLFNIESVTSFREEHKRIVKGQYHARRMPKYEIDKIHCQQFSDWFKRRVARMEEQGVEVAENIKWLARGPHRSVRQYSGYLVKGANYASSRDRRSVDGVVNYYGKLNDIIELNYSGQIRVVLFKCDWVDINRDCKKDNSVTLVNFSYKAHTGANLTDDPFVLASQVDKVFYVREPKHKDWEVVRHVKLRDAFDMRIVDDDHVARYSNDSTFDVPNLDRIARDGDDGINVTSDMERDVDVEEDDDDLVLFLFMGKRKRLCITSTETPERQPVETHETTETQGDLSSSQSHHAIETEDDQSSPYEISSNEQGARKKVRGYTQKAETWKMNSNQKIVDTFNTFGKPVGEEGNELVQYIGTLVRMPNHVSISYTDWRKVPMERKEDLYTLVKARANDLSLTIDEIVARQTKSDDRVNPTQFKELVTHWFDPKFQAINNNGVYPSRGEMYVKTRTCKVGSIVDDKAAEIVASLKAIASDSTSTSGYKYVFTSDDYSRVNGPEKRGYVRLVGRMPSVKKSGDSSTDSQTIQQLKSVVNVTVNIIQEHIPNANISEVLNNMNIEVPGIASVPNNSHSVNQRSPSRSGTNNGNYFYVSNFANVVIGKID